MHLHCSTTLPHMSDRSPAAAQYTCISKTRPPNMRDCRAQSRMYPELHPEHLSYIHHTRGAVYLDRERERLSVLCTAIAPDHIPPSLSLPAFIFATLGQSVVRLFYQGERESERRLRGYSWPFCRGRQPGRQAEAGKQPGYLQGRLVLSLLSLKMTV